MVAVFNSPWTSYLQEGCLHPFLLQEALPDHPGPRPTRPSSDSLNGSLAARHSLPGIINSLFMQMWFISQAASAVGHVLMRISLCE